MRETRRDLVPADGELLLMHKSGCHGGSVDNTSCECSPGTELPACTAMRIIGARPCVRSKGNARQNKKPSLCPGTWRVQSLRKEDAEAKPVLVSAPGCVRDTQESWLR